MVVPFAGDEGDAGKQRRPRASSDAGGGGGRKSRAHSLSPLSWKESLFLALSFSPRSTLQVALAGVASRPVASLAAAAADAAMHAALKSTAVYAPSALALVLAGALCRATGDRKYQTFGLLLASAVGFALVPVAVAGGSSRGALFSLIVGSSGGVGALAALATWPDRYATGRHRCAEYAFW